MRVVAGLVLFSVTMLAAAAFAARTGAAADIPSDDPDLPIRTARFGDEAPLAAVPAAPPEAAARAHATSRPDLGQALRALPHGVRLSLAAPQPETFSFAPPEGPPAFGPAAVRQAADDFKIDARAILLRIGPKGEDASKGRWFIFAAGSGEAFGLNLIRDPVRGLRRAGWSLERLAEHGKAQAGVGWRRGYAQVSLAAARREIGAYGISQEDTVVGVTVSVKP